MIKRQLSSFMREGALPHKSRKLYAYCHTIFGKFFVDKNAISVHKICVKMATP